MSKGKHIKDMTPKDVRRLKRKWIVIWRPEETMSDEEKRLKRYGVLKRVVAEDVLGVPDNIYLIIPNASEREFLTSRGENLEENVPSISKEHTEDTSVPLYYKFLHWIGQYVYVDKKQ